MGVGGLVLLAGCASLSTRFDQNVTASFAHDDMRKFETASLELYYPARYQKEAMRVATRLNACVAQLKTLPESGTPRQKLVVYLTSAEFNNAYVQPQTIGSPQQMVLAHHLTLELFNWFELGQSEIGDISCHESVHYIQMLETSGFWRVVNAITGGVWQSNIFTESWFLEGLATHYEGRLGKDTGRPSSAIWNGMFESGVAARAGKMNAGDLSPENRDEIPFGGNYVVGMQFVDYLARTYGEKKLWELVDLQARSIFSPLAVTLRFKHVYGKSVGALFDDFSAELRKNLKVRVRPTDQEVLMPNLGYYARIAASPSDGAVALLTAERDDVVRLTVRERDGRIRFHRRVTLILPERRWISIHPELVSGMSFTGNGRFLYFVDVDTGSLGEDVPRLFQVDAHTGEVGRIWENVRGLGGSVSPDGKRYVYNEVTGDTANLVQLELETDRRTVLTHFSGRSSLGAAAYAPDGERIAFSRFTGTGFDLFLRQRDGSLEQLTFDGHFNYGAHWADGQRLVFMREVEGRAQAFSLDLTTRNLLQLTDAPFVALDPTPTGPNDLVMVNRDGWGWSLDHAPLRTGGTPLAAGASAAPPPLDFQEDSPVPAGVDHAYEPLDHLFIPELRTPFVYALPGPTGYDVIFGGSVSGSDRLGLHNWAANVSYESQSKGPSFNVGYANYQLAPWLISASVGRAAIPGIRDLSANLNLGRTFFTSPLGFGFVALQRDEDGLHGATSRARYLGPSVNASYSATEGTSYGGIKRGLILSAFASAYSRALGSDLDFQDLGGSISGYLPLPGLLRQSFVLNATGRALVGLPARLRLLSVGGIPSGFFELHPTTPSTGDRGPNILLPGGIGFSEPLRGYEDHSIQAQSAAIFNARWRYPLIIDYGFASTFYLFPSVFFRQLDVEAFGSGAHVDDAERPWHRAVGASARFRMTFGQALPVTLYYQFAYRFDDHLPPENLFGLAFQ